MADTPVPPPAEPRIVSEIVTPPKSAPSVAPTPAPKPEGVVPVHTLKDDLKNVVHDKQLSLVQAAALEQDKRSHAGHEAEAAHAQPRARVARPLGIAILFILLGSLALGAVFLIIRDRTATNEDIFVVKGLLFSEQTVPFPIQRYSSAELKRLLAESRVSMAASLGVITQLVPTVEERDAETDATRDRPATTGEFLTALGAHPSEELLRALGSELFFGLHTVDEHAPLLIIPVVSYERAFAGMLAWEKTMNADLAPIFTRVSPLIRDQSGLLVERSFEDAVMRNYDVRTLKDDAGTVQLYYSFPTRDLLIIAESPYSFAEILARLRADRRL